MIQFLDCTLRDGAHVNSGNFGERHILNIIDGLTKSCADIVEIGFLKQAQYSKDVTYFPRIEDAYNVLEKVSSNKNVEYALMARADQYDITNLSECNGKIKIIRIAFYYDYLNGAIAFAKEIALRGYSFTLNLINTPGCTVQELRNAIDCANKINPYALTIVDTFGVLDIKALEAIAKEYNSNLNPKIKIGLHVHENLSLAFSLVQHFIDLLGGNRDVIIDGSLMGIGRAPGNLCTELIANYLNDNFGKNIQIQKILELIQNDIAPIKTKCRWGYSPEFFLSAKYKVHRSYAEYLSEEKYSLAQIDFLLSKIEHEHSGKFNKEYIDMIAKNGVKK